jgi:hypothetical protein
MQTPSRLASLCLFLLCAFTPLAGRAAGVYFQPNTRSLPVGETFEVSVLLDTEGGRINAVEGTVVFPESIVLEQVRDGGSRVPLWVEKPLPGVPGSVHFSGVIPGGYEGTEGELFRLVFRPVSEGETMVLLGDLRLLVDDGLGTEAAARFGSFRLVASPPIHRPDKVEVKDLIPPGPFEPMVVHDPTIFDGDWFVVFAAQDKGFGIARYDVVEVRYPFLRAFARWASAVSPYRLQDQTRSRWVFVRAIDVAGNERVVRLPPIYALPWYKDSVFWIILAGALCLVALLSGVLYRRAKSR